MAKRETGFEMKGTVVEVLRGTKFKVELDDNHLIVECTLSGKLRQNYIHILNGDKVTVEVSMDDVSKGRITWRDK